VSLHSFSLEKDFFNSLLVMDALSESAVKRQGFFRPEPITRLLGEHLRGAKDNRKQLWTLLMFQLWHEHYVRL